MKKILVLVLVFALLAGLWGCKTVSNIASNVAEAAGKELEVQIKNTLEQNKVDVIELKTAAGKLNDDGGKLQFYCAALVKSQNYDLLTACADAIGKVLADPATREQMKRYNLEKIRNYSIGAVTEQMARLYESVM